MDGQHKNRGGPLYWLGRRSRRFWIIAVVLTPVLYVASFGPACWLARQGCLPPLAVAHAYRPFVRVGHSGPESVRPMIQDFAGYDADGWPTLYVLRVMLLIEEYDQLPEYEP